jgi:Domain of unknown function (DUF4262)
MGYVELARARGARMDDYDWRTLEILDEFGWMVQQVLGDETNPPFAYTVGATLHRPALVPWELMIVGLDLDDAKQTLNLIISRAADSGEPLLVGPVDDVLDHRRAAYIAEIPAERVTREWFGYGLWFARHFGHGSPRMAQVVWSDGATGHFPWHATSAPDGGTGWADQPLLCDVPSVT